MITEAPFLFSIAALSVSLAGFAGLVAAFRRGVAWEAIHLFRLREIAEFGFARGRSSSFSRDRWWRSSSFFARRRDRMVRG